MKPREIKRLHLIGQALEGKISQQQAAELAGLSTRQMRRLMKRVKDEGERGILHRRRGKPSNRRIADQTKQRILALFEKHYGDYGPTLASEKLQERHQIGVHPETLRLWLRQARLLTSNAEPDRTGSGGHGGAALGRWCRWTDRTMTGWKDEALSWC